MTKVWLIAAMLVILPVVGTRAGNDPPGSVEQISLVVGGGRMDRQATDMAVTFTTAQTVVVKQDVFTPSESLAQLGSTAIVEAVMTTRTITPKAMTSNTRTGSIGPPTLSDVAVTQYITRDSRLEGTHETGVCFKTGPQNVAVGRSNQEAVWTTRSPMNS